MSIEARDVAPEMTKVEAGVRSTTPRATSPAKARLKDGFARAAREPLTHFVLAGLALFVVGAVHQGWTDRHRIVVTPAHAAQIASGYALQFGARPDRPTLDALIDRDVHDEILFRQGEALKLAQDDEIVRRRVVQKMQFLMQDLSAPSEPTAAQLQRYYDSHASRYVAPPRATFSHIYFSSDKGGDAVAKARAEKVLRTLSGHTVRAPERGDPFPDLYDFSAYEPEQVDRLFGRSPFSDAVMTGPVGRWAGPFQSGYGWHLLYVDARQTPPHSTLAQVRDAVRADYLQGAQDAANQAAFDKLARDYRIVREDRGAGR